MNDYIIIPKDESMLFYHKDANGNIYRIPQWVSVKDRLPKIFPEHYLFYTGKKEVVLGFVYDDKAMMFEIGNGIIYINDLLNDKLAVATHWMPLPEPPKEEYE